MPNTNNMNETDLLKLKEEIEEAKTEEARLKGVKETLLAQAKKLYGTDSIEGLKNALENLTTKKDKLTEQLDDGLEKLEAQINPEVGPELTDKSFE